MRATSLRSAKRPHREEIYRAADCILQAPFDPAPQRGSDAIQFIDVFCGAGGLSLGLEMAGFHPILAIDHDKSACATYLVNRPEMSRDAVLNATTSEIIARGEIPNVPFVIGGPPCQGFSMANRQRLSADSRNSLYRDFITILARSNCQIALMENVPAMATAVPMMAEDFREIGFEVRPFRLNAKEFGFPQNRNRVFFLCLKSADVFLTTKLFECFADSISLAKAECRQKFVLSDAISGLPPLVSKTVRNSTDLENDLFGYTKTKSAYSQDTNYAKLINGGVRSDFLFNHRTKYNNERDIEIFSRLRPGEKSDADSIRDIMPYKSRSHIFKDKFYRLKPEEPCKTITAHMYYDCHMYIHPTQHRGLTPREAARVQGFPDHYFFLGFPNEWYRQIGNAVSPLVARIVGDALRTVARTWGIS